MMTGKHNRLFRRLLALGVGTLVLALLTTTGLAQDAEPLAAETVQTNLNVVWLLLAGFLVFFMQAGFAMLEGGFIRGTGGVNSMAENFMDACITGIVFFVIGYGIAFAPSAADSPLIPLPQLALGGIDGTGAGDGLIFAAFFFQFAFAGAAATIATGAMAERTDFRGKILYSALVALIVYPVVVYWTWGTGWLFQSGYIDFAGSSIVHMVGGIIALMGAAIVGPRVGRVWGSPPAASNLMMATLGTFILWFGWYGFNVGSTLVATDTNALGLVTVNTTLAACIGAISAMTVGYIFKGGKWHLGLILNGSLGGLVGITAGCAVVNPLGALLIGTMGGVLVVFVPDIIERVKIDDAVGAFAVHGACGAMGTLAVGFLGNGPLVEALGGTGAGLLMGGGVDQLIVQVVGVGAITVWTTVTSILMFAAIKALGVLRMPEKADAVGIDVYEHGASVMPDVLPMPEPGMAGAGD